MEMSTKEIREATRQFAVYRLAAAVAETIEPIRREIRRITDAACIEIARNAN